jgi:hypothetical protein
VFSRGCNHSINHCVRYAHTMQCIADAWDVPQRFRLCLFTLLTCVCPAIGPSPPPASLPPRVVALATDIARGLSYLHTRRPAVIHKDLKPANALVDRAWKVKLCDFGLAANTGNQVGSQGVRGGRGGRGAGHAHL